MRSLVLVITWTLWLASLGVAHGAPPSDDNPATTTSEDNATLDKNPEPPPPPLTIPPPAMPRGAAYHLPGEVDETPGKPRERLLPSGRATVWFFNLKLGTNQGVYNSDSGLFHLVLDFGRAVTSSSRFSVVLPLQFCFVTLAINTSNDSRANSLAQITVPLGVQYDLPLFDSGFSLTTRLLIGYQFQNFRSIDNLNLNGSLTINSHRGFVAPELGVVWRWRGRLNAGADLLSLPIVFVPTAANVMYRVLFYVGANF